ncbi:MAG: NAD(P)-dependent alcohol dehydrogenase, partial [Alphaproteobacteria bacterium]|nr:NAD(P)-dependent alcohol dehydrogenase [Alphaproteobacteria bacterium]MBT5859946.1 NAD(P)-dependent alcohol dehydrogenase [Alphaproteobacteria bacterium]
MKAIVQNGYGDPERVLSLAEVDRPTVNGDDDVLVRIKATSVNTPDWITVAGIPKIMRIAMGLRRPKTPIRGTDVAGVVEQVGPGVTGFAPGDEVFGSTWIGMKSPGTYAEYTIIKASNIAKKPAELSFEDAAASVMSGLTALSAMDQVAKAGPGMHILINGASGGVGTFAVQFAKAAGAEVTGVCGTANVDLVRSLGADHVIDYTADDFTQGAARYDVILDNVVNHPPAMTARALAPGGVLLPNSVGNT